MHPLGAAIVVTQDIRPTGRAGLKDIPLYALVLKQSAFIMPSGSVKGEGERVEGSGGYWNQAISTINADHI